MIMIMTIHAVTIPERTERGNHIRATSEDSQAAVR